MALDPAQTPLFHITPIANLASIVGAGGLHSDAALANVPHEVFGHGNIKQRRLTQYRVPCCDNRFVGSFVPFYYCPRSPMLYTINAGATGKPPGCQREIVHLVTTVATLLERGGTWAISDGNAGAAHTSFYRDLQALEMLDWPAIRATQWQGRQHEKAAEFLFADFVPWSAILGVGCMNEAAAERVRAILGPDAPAQILVRPGWYYT